MNAHGVYHCSHLIELGLRDRKLIYACHLLYFTAKLVRVTIFNFFSSLQFTCIALRCRVFCLANTKTDYRE